jgi:hypothetical protein
MDITVKFPDRLGRAWYLEKDKYLGIREVIQ